MLIVWGLVAVAFVVLYVLIHRARVRTMRRFIERGHLEDGANPDDWR